LLRQLTVGGGWADRRDGCDRMTGATDEGHSAAGHAIGGATATSVAALCRDAAAVDVLSRWV
jgi:hypothetical protein